MYIDQEPIVQGDIIHGTANVIQGTDCTGSPAYGLVHQCCPTAIRKTQTTKAKNILYTLEFSLSLCRKRMKTDFYLDTLNKLLTGLFNAGPQMQEELNDKVARLCLVALMNTFSFCQLISKCWGREKGGRGQFPTVVYCTESLLRHNLQPTPPPPPAISAWIVI